MSIRKKKRMTKWLIVLCGIFLLFLVDNLEGIRPFKNRASSTSATCNTKTALAALACPCALVGQGCRDFGSRCFAPGNSLIGNIAKGMPKRGICACAAAYPYTSPVRNTCVSRYLTIPSASAGSCLFRDATITSVNVRLKSRVLSCQSTFSSFFIDVFFCLAIWFYSAYDICPRCCQ
jgi:hypothetical protein